MKHPYIHLEASADWAVVARAINDLAKNGDLKESTSREYIVGYLCKALDDARKSTAAPTKLSPPSYKRKHARANGTAIRSVTRRAG